MKKQLVGVGILAGLLGGLAEIGWLALYAEVSPITVAEVGREITTTVFPSAAETSWAPWAGAGIHLALSAALGLAFVGGLWGMSGGHPGRRQIWATAVLVLVAVWGVNFLLVLPVLNSNFLALMPYGVTLLSKTLFGVAMAGVLVRAA